MRVKKAVIPAAGLGTRFLPATKAQPKEMLPLVDKPAIQFVVEQAVEAGIRDILIITGRGKRTLEDHFDRSYELEWRLEQAGKFDDLKVVREISDMAMIHYIRQKEPAGLGAAVALAEPHVGREPFAVLLGAMAGQITHGIAETRHLSESEVQGLIDKGPLFADEAKEAHIVDRIGYRDEALTEAHRRAGSGAELLSLSRYIEGAGRPHTKGPAIALIYGAGLIVQGGGEKSPLSGTAEMNAREVARAFRDAFRDADVRAILFRIDSPGGSAVASESIWREVVRARERGKPVIVSMGDTAGSGGYYIAAPADKIVAEPATLTGSIGVVAGKLVITELLNKLRVNVETIERGANSGMFSALRDFSPAERQRLDAFLDQTYRGFKAHVAAGRHLSDEAVEAVAKGRVWSGEDAKKNGLVDELGGYAVALRLAREAAKLSPDAPIKLVTFPHQKSTAEILFDRLLERERDSDAAPSGTLGRAWTALAALTSPLDLLLGGVLEDPGVLRMPPLGEIR